MYNNNTNVSGYKQLSPKAQKDEKSVAEYKRLVESVRYDNERYTEITESEWDENLAKIKKEYYRRYGNELNEADSYWGVSPFDWISGIKIPNIFKPLKWLAALLAGGLALLLAALYKLLKEGKKQLAIARVRQWIKSLVVLADGGYKKTRRTKDSLFLIQARARRDILQAGVMAAYAAGIDVPQKHNEPTNPTESAKNESWDMFGDDYLFEDNNVNATLPTDNVASFRYGSETYPFTDEGIKRFIEERKNANQVSDIASLANYIVAVDNNGQQLPLKDDKALRQSFIKVWNIKNNPLAQQKAETKANNAQAQNLNSLRNLSKAQNAYDAEMQKQNNAVADVSVNTAIADSFDYVSLLPEDSQVDWSLLNTLVTSSWFGLVKHKTNLWAEAKSVFKMTPDEIYNENDRQKYVTNIITNVNAALSKITTPSIASNYTNVLNQFVTVMMRRDQKGSSKMMSRDRAADVGMRVGNHGGNESQLTFGSALNEDGNVQAVQNPNNGQVVIQLGNDEAQRQNRRAELDFDATRPLVDNTFKAMQNIFTANPITDFLVYKKTVEQMNNFLNELTKSVHTIIDSVAKKVSEKTNGSGRGVEGAINHFLSDGGDPKQNRSLKGLWDNIGRPQLDSRAITRAQSLTASPEFTWMLEVLTVTIPLSLMSTFMQNGNEKNRCLIMLQNNGMTYISKGVIENLANQSKMAKNAADKVEKPQSTETDNSDIQETNPFDETENNPIEETEIQNEKMPR